MINTLEIDGVVLEFGSKRILQDVYLKIETGKVVGLLGRNGSGKSCLMNIIFGQLIPNEKSIRLNDKCHLHKHFPKEVITYLPQFGFIPKSLTINSVFKDYEIDADRFYHYFPEFRKLNKSKIKHLSGGEHRVIEIYIILVSKSQFCMLDEPFSQVMPRHIDAIKEIIINEKKHKGILISDHLYEHIIDVCDEIKLITDTVLVQIDDVIDIERYGYAKKESTPKALRFCD